MFKRIIDILIKPYPYYIPFSRSFRLIVIFSIVIPIFLLTFQPFGLNNWNCEIKFFLLAGLTIPIFLTLVFNFYLLAKLIPVFFNEDHWNIWREIVWSLWTFFTIALTTSFYWTIVPECFMSSIQWGEQMGRAFLIGLLPATICYYFNYSQSLKRKLQKVQEFNKKLRNKITYYEHGKQTLIAENNIDVINISTKSLILIQSYDNYSKIVWEKSGRSESQLIRSSLKHLQSQIEYPFVLRCHRSFIVNLAKVDEVRGNARDYKLKLEQYPELIPVSREAYKKISNLFQEFTPKSDAPVSFSLEKNKEAPL